ncbi:MAG: flagellar biosynthetic protein FliO [Candidatus Puniceispirillaceae bacterium]
MPVDAIQPYQIIIMVAFLLLLMVALFIVRRFRGGLSKHIHRTRRMRHIEDMALTPHQRLHLVEVDGQTFMIHAGKGHAATVVGVNGTGGTGAADTPMTLMDIQKPTPKPASPKPQKATKQLATRPASAAPSSADQQHSTANVDQIASAIAEARRRNPSLGLGK